MMTLPRLLQIASSSLFVALWFASAVMGQTETATVSGLVTDRTVAAVGGAEVRLQSVERGTVTTTTTNDAGIYVFPSVQPGQYQISIQKQGFKQVDSLGLIVNVQDHIEQNFRLEVGSVAESVTVEAGASMINTTDASVSTVVDQTYVKNMPLNGRSFQDLILLTPGVVTQSPQTNNFVGLGKTGEFSVNGQRTEANYYTVDGVSANVGAATGSAMISISSAGPSGLAAATALGTTQALVSVDDLQEFRVQSSTYSAEYGRNPGGQFAFDTKSGTNQWHGTGFEYLRNGAVDAQDWFSDYLGVTQPALRQNDFGGTLGGPVEFPRLYHGKDKTFFFVSYEGLRLTNPHPGEAFFVPDLCRRGVAASCTGTNTPAPAILQPVMNSFPLPSPSGIDDQVNGFAQFIGTWSDRSSLNSTSVRFDHTLNDKVRLFFRFSDTPSNSRSRAGGPLRRGIDQTNSFVLRTYTAGVDSVLSNRLSNQFRINYSSNETTADQAIDALGGNTPVDLRQLAGLSSTPEVFVGFIYRGYNVLNADATTAGTVKQWNLVDTVGFSSGRHQFKFGADYRRLASFVLQPPVASYLFFSKNAVSTNSGFFADQSQANVYPLFTNFSAFAQNQWKPVQRLSLTLGLRWEVNPAPGATQGLKPYTIQFQGAGPDTWTLAPQGTPLWQTTWYNFAPRVGAAYMLRDAPGRQTVLRGGGGVFFDTGQQLGAGGFSGVGFVTSRPPCFACPFPGNPLPFPTIVNPPVPPYANIYGFSLHLQLPYTLHWNASVEQALGKSQALTISYVASRASRLLRQDFFSAPKNPNATGAIIVTDNGLTSDYNSLQAQFRRTLSHGLTTLASYTWSHCLDSGTQNYTQNAGTTVVLQTYQRGNCDSDVRHSLSAAASYDLPNVGHNGFMNAILYRWGVDGRVTARTAFPVTLNGNTIVDPTSGRLFNAGLDLVPGQPLYLSGSNCDSTLQGLGDLHPGRGCPGGRAINPLAFTNASAGAVGNAPRNFARGFGAWQTNLAIRRDFPLHESLHLQFRAEAFNIFNHPNFGTINSNFGLPTFGQAAATLANSLGILSPLYQTGGSRSMQFALKLVF